MQHEVENGCRLQPQGEQWRVTFAHGRDSGPSGDKALAMSRVCEELGLPWVAPDFRDLMDAGCRADRLKALLPTGTRHVLVGSSMGGWAAARATELMGTSAQKRVAGLFLLCPALALPGYYPARLRPALPGQRMLLVHGRHDEVVPLAHSEQAARDWQCGLLTVEDDHRLCHSTARIAQLFRGFLVELLSQSAAAPDASNGTAPTQSESPKC